MSPYTAPYACRVASAPRCPQGDRVGGYATVEARSWRRATAEDAVALCDRERMASETGLSHVFGDLPYPDDDVLARWALLLDDPGVTLEVVEDDRGFVVLVAH